MKKFIYTLFFSMTAFMCLAQTAFSGRVTDGNEPLIGASVMIKGTSTGTVTDVDGNFELQTDLLGDYKLVISYIGYETKTMNVGLAGGTMLIGDIEMSEGGIGLETVVVTGVMDIVKDRRTPVAVSTITTAEILAKGGNVEFPDLMKATPSIYVAGQAGGYGDSEVFTRGFDQTNTAFLLNGQPINGMEDGRMYWSNWSGMSDVATAIQVQRGLGSSKLAISSVGGTTNIIMKPTAQKKGGSVSYLMGNDAYNKITASYNTGMINDKYGVTVLLTHWQGDGWADGTQGQGQNYFISAGYKLNEKHMFNFLLTGAPQWHDQNFNKRISSHYADGSFNIRYNNNWGTLDGEYKTTRRNYYHKPVANINWDFAINEKSSLSTVLYGSWGRGGGTGGIGSSSNRKFTSEGYWDFDAIVAANQASAADGGDGREYVIRSSVNNHAWYGAVSTYDNQLTDELNFSIGADVRAYRGSHFRQVADLLGASAYSQFGTARFPDGREITETYDPNPWSAISSYADVENRIAYANDETIRYAGLFSQLEYSNDHISAFVQGAVSQQAHVRFEIQNELEANEASEKVVNPGYNFKTGASYLINDENSVFFNTGVYSRQPFHDNIYLNFSNLVNPVTENENIFGLEAGYKYTGDKLTGNINVYRTLWENRTTTREITEGEEIDGILFPNGGFANLSDLNQLHRGIEADFRYAYSSRLSVKGYASIGDWKYEGDAVSDLYNDERVLVDSKPSLFVDGIHVGGAAQTTAGLGTRFSVSDDLSFDIDGYHYANLYSNIGAQAEELKLPSYTLFDLGASYRLNIGDQILMFRANIYNVFGTEYISRATSAIPASTTIPNWNGVNKDNFVTFGTTRTWNLSVRYSF